MGITLGIVLDVPTEAVAAKEEGAAEIVRGLTCVFGVFGSRAPCGAGVCI